MRQTEQHMNKSPCMRLNIRDQQHSMSSFKFYCRGITSLVVEDHVLQSWLILMRSAESTKSHVQRQLFVTLWRWRWLWLLLLIVVIVFRCVCACVLKEMCVCLRVCLYSCGYVLWTRSSACLPAPESRNKLPDAGKIVLFHCDCFCEIKNQHFQSFDSFF